MGQVIGCVHGQHRPKGPVRIRRGGLGCSSLAGDGSNPYQSSHLFWFTHLNY